MNNPNGSKPWNFSCILMPMSKFIHCSMVLGALLCGCQHRAVDSGNPDQVWFESASLEELNSYIYVNTNSPFAYFDRGRRNAELGRYAEVLLDSVTCIERWPENAHGYWLRGWLLNEQQVYGEALADYNKAVERAPDKCELYIQRGDIYINLNEANLALSDFNKAIELDQDDYYPYLMRGIIYYGSILNPTQAESDFSKAIRLWPESSYSYLMRGNLYYWLQKDDLALADFDRVVELMPDHTDGYQSRAALFYRQKNLKGALADYLKMVDLDPTIYRVMKRIGDIYVLQGRTDEAIEVYKEFMFWYGRLDDPFSNIEASGPSIEIPQTNRDEVLKHYPECDELYFEWSNISLAEKDYESALSLVNRGIELNPENMDMILFGGIIRSVLGDQAGALKDISRAIGMNPVYAMGYVGRGTIHGSSVLAVEDYTKAISLCDEIAFFYYLRAEVYSELGQCDFALADYDKAVELGAGSSKYRRARAFFYEKIGQYDLAMNYFDAQIAEQPDSYLPYVARAGYYQRQKRHTESISDFMAVIEKAPASGVSAHNLALHYLNRADAYIELGEVEKALLDATIAVDLSDGKNGYALMRRGSIYKQNEQVELALADYDRALEIDPDDRYAHYYRAQALYSLMRFEHALEEYDFIIENDIMPEGYEHLAVWGRAENYVQLGRYEEAIEDMDDLLIEYPTRQDLIDRRKEIADHAGIKESSISGLLNQ